MTTTPRPHARLLAACAVLTMVLAACSGTESDVLADQTCAVPEDAGLDTPEGWLRHLDHEPGDISLVVDAGDGAPVQHLATEVRPAASAIKVVHLLAYAAAVTAGELDPQEPVPLARWEEFYHPADGGAHAAALDRLDIPAVAQGDGVALAEDPSATVPLDDLVSAMVQESDNAAADYLLDRLGADALAAAATGAGMSDTTVTSLLGTVLGAGGPGLDEEPDALAERYRSDEEWAVEMLQTADGSYPVQQAYVAEHGPSTTAADLAAAYRAVADGALGEAGELAREHLEWQGADDAGTVVGFKAGSLPGVVAGGFEVRHADGATASAAVLVEGLAEADHAEAVTTFAWQQLVLEAVADPSRMEQLRCVTAADTVPVDRD